MKFLILGESPLFAALHALHVRGKKCEDAAKEWIVNRFGKELQFAGPDENIWGGVAVVQFKSAKKGWRQVSGEYKLYSPTRLVDINAIKKLPKVLKSEVKTLLKYGNYPAEKGINTIPSMQLGDNYALISVPDEIRGYEPVEGMQEILGSRYNDLFDMAEEYKKT